MKSSPMESDEFPSVATLVRYIHERSDELKKAIVVPPGVAYVENETELLAPVGCFTLLLCVANGEAIVVRDEAVEAILNNGILNRMHVKIELWTGVKVES
jgi:hypothetical protein